LLFSNFAGDRMNKLYFVLLFGLVNVLFCKVYTLDELIRNGLDKNEQIEAKSYEIKASKKKEYQAFSSFFPSVNSRMRYTYLNEIPSLVLPEEFAPFFGGSSKFSMGRHDNYELDISLTQPVFTGFSLTNMLSLSGLNVFSKINELNKTKAQLILDIQKGYFNLLRVLSGYEATLSTKESFSSQVKDLESMFNEGLVAKNDLLKAQIALSEIELAELSLTNAIVLSKQNLSVLTDIPSDEIDIDTSTSFDKLDFSLDEMDSIALSNNYDLKSLDYGLKASEKYTNLSYAKLYPTIALAANWIYSNPNDEYENAWKDSWNMSLVADLNVFSFGKDIAAIKEAKYSEYSIALQKNYAEKMVLQGLNALFLSLKEAKDKFEITNRTVEQAKENFRITKEKFINGSATNTEVLDAASTLYRSKSTSIDALCEYNIKISEIKFLLCI